jgi:hypothetical protein
MKWLLTLNADPGTSRLEEMLRSAGSRLGENATIIPMEGDVVVEVEGPADFPDRVKSAPEVKAVHPSSDLTLY